MSGPRVVHRRCVVEVPATSANLGAGFDALALALEIHNRVEVTWSAADESAPVSVTVEGEGEGEIATDGSDRFTAALLAGLGAKGVEGREVPGLRVRMTNGIPLSRGLGSSAAATVGGLAAAAALLGEELDISEALALAAAVEGHADNAAAAALGGFVVVVLADMGRGHEAVTFEPPPRLRTVLFVPDVPLSTEAMRAALPATVPHRDAAFNVGRAALAVAAFAKGRLELLRAATEDRLHEPYRASAFPALPALVAAARGAGALGACLSGAGSTVIAFTETDEAAAAVAAALTAAGERSRVAGTARVVRPASRGVIATAG